MSIKLHKWTLFRISVTTIMLYYLVNKVDWHDLINLTNNIDYFWIIWAYLFFGIAIVASACRWNFLLKVQDVFLPFRTTLSLTFIGLFFNSFLLGATGGDVIKLFYLYNSYPTKKTKVTLTVIMDRITGLSVLLLFALLTLPFQYHSLFATEETKNIFVAILSFFLFLILLIVFVGLFPYGKIPDYLIVLWKKLPLNNTFELLIKGFRQYRYDDKSTILAILSSFIVQLFVFIAAFFIAKAIAIEVTFWQLVVIITLVTCLVSLPVSIGGHGIREGGFLLMFSIFTDLPLEVGEYFQETVILFSLLYLSLSLFWSLFGGGIYLFYRHPNEHLLQAVNDDLKFNK